jgi:hypothetical protein
MAQNQEVSEKLKEALDVADQCFKAENSAGYDVLSEQLEELETLTRESYQQHGDYKSLLDKLEKGNPLTSDEVNTLKQAIVGDAEYYLKYDDDFDRCKTEAGKIVDEIRRVQSTDLDVDALMHLSVLCREANRALVPAGYYLEQKERLRKFEDAARGPIDPETGRVLADMIRHLTSPDRP